MKKAAKNQRDTLADGLQSREWWPLAAASNSTFFAISHNRNASDINKKARTRRAFLQNLTKVLR